MEDAQPQHPLKAARKALDMRQGDVALLAGCSVPLISSVEHGYVPPLPKQEAIAAAVAASAGSFW